ncbi:MAG TPA: amino acid adenylation domain-containing protein [Blastocatellia bacterium]|nr:amino acid adenylation domain-containing protein [Blastocatellia bacterium]
MLVKMTEDNNTEPLFHNHYGLVSSPHKPTRSEVHPRAVCLHQMFEAQVARTPDAPCLVFGTEQLSYSTMNARANQLAHRLRRLGVRPETLVGVCMDRSPDLVIALYAILKAGGAYVPFDSSYPRERLEFMMTDTRVSLLLTQEHLAEQFSSWAIQTVLSVDAEWPDIAEESTTNPDNLATADNLAYVIYTSGSTGQPKGVMIEHRGICQQLQWMQTTYPLSSDDAVLLRTPFSFDLSLYELFSPLLAGARLVLAAPDYEKDTAYLIALIQRADITTLFLVPSLLQMLLAESEFAACNTLQHIFCSGEALPFALQQRFFAQMPAHVNLHNLYGPTEASVECTHWDCERDTQRNFVPIGRPIANYEIVLLDEQRNPVPVGQVGELHIGGIGLARGYWNRPELTAERFIQLDAQIEPFQSNRLYRTGDLARWHTDGVLECLGRIDFQVKIRGHRIELGEIETVLLEHAAVRECVVMAREDKPGDKRLVAYIVPQGQAMLTHESLRQHLLHKLPEYMIPHAFVPLSAFPLSPNGKVDRKQLPAPEAVPRLLHETNYIAPVNDIERKLTELWEATLRVAPIGVTENFFALGGHSLFAVRIFATLETMFGQRLPLATLLQAPTIRQLATLLSEQSGKPFCSSLVALQPQGDRPPFFCIHAVGGNVLEYYELARQFGPDQPFYALQSAGLGGTLAPHESIPEMARHYLHEIRAVQPQGPYHLGGRSFGGMVAYEMALQLHEQGETVALLALLDTDPIGWMKLFPTVTAAQLRLRFLTLRIKRHLRNLHHLRGHEQLRYVQEKAGYKKRKLHTWHWHMQRRSSSSTSLTDTLREVEELNYRAEKTYVPRPYAGCVTFFSAEEEVSALENQFGWQTLARVEVVPVPGNHQSMIKTPHVQTLAAQIMLRLSQPTND